MYRHNEYEAEINEVITVTDSPVDPVEEGIVVPLDRINPDTLRNLVGEFVTREWSDLSDAGISFETKIAQVMKQLEEQQILVVYDPTSETCNIVAADRIAK
jgi:uncharacterized protein YheU (UPF0270 family)